MNATKCLYFLLATLLFTTGCLPKRVVWSPDGSQALVNAADGVHVMNADGKLGDAWVQNAGSMLWLPDGKRVILCHTRNLKRWNELVKILSDSEQQEVLQNAALIRTEAMSFTGDWNAFAAAVQPKLQTKFFPDPWPTALIYLRDKQPEGLAAKLGDAWKLVEETEAKLVVIELYDVEKGTLQTQRVYWHGWQQILDLRLAPNGKYLLISMGMETKEEFRDEIARLFVLNLEGNNELHPVAEKTSWYPDWSRDGQYVLYASVERYTKNKEEMVFGNLCRRRVIDEQGNGLQELPPEEPVARIVFDNMVCVRGLKEGGLLFTGTGVTIPSTPDDKGERTLFIASPGEPWQVRPLVVRAAHGDMVDPLLIELSPHEKWAAVTSVEGHIAVADIATGDVTAIELDNVREDARSIATWRNDHDLCFIAHSEKEDHAEVALWSMENQKKQVLSTEWPAAAVENFLAPSPTPTP